MQPSSPEPGREPDPEKKRIHDYNTGFPDELNGETLLKLVQYVRGEILFYVCSNPPATKPELGEKGFAYWEITHQCFAAAARGESFICITRNSRCYEVALEAQLIITREKTSHRPLLASSP